MITPRFVTLLRLLVMFGMCSGISRSVAQTVYLSNLSETNGSQFYVGLNGATTYQAGGQFLTGGSSLSIGKVSLGMSVASGTPAGATFAVKLYSNDPTGINHPGTELASFTGNTSPSTAATNDYVLASAYTLSASARYWIVATATGTTGGYYQWEGGSTGQGSSSYGWFVAGGGVSSNDGTSWSGAATSPRFEISSFTAVPEPSTYAALLGLTGLGFAIWQRRGALVSRQG